LIAAVVSAVAITHGRTAPAPDNRLQGAFRKPAVSGWTFVHVQGTPAQIGYQHGYLLSAEIADLENVYKLELAHDNGKDWNFFRDAAKNVLWPHIDREYRDELQASRMAVAARGVKMDLWDVVAMNARRGVELLRRPIRQGPQHTFAVDRHRAGPLQRLRRHGQFTPGWKNRHRAQRLDRLSGRFALDDCSRCCPAKGYRFIMDTLPASFTAATTSP